METLTKTVDRMSESFAEQPDIKESFREFGSRVGKEARQEEKKERKYAPREVNLADHSPEAREFFEATGERAESKDSAKGSRRESSAEKHAAKPAEKPNAKESEQPNARTGEKPTASVSDDSHVEPIAAGLAERHWQGKLQGKEIETHVAQVNGRMGVVLDFLSSHPQKAEMEKGFRSLCAGSPPIQQPGFFRDLVTCLAEVPNREKVFEHITLQAEDRDFLRKVKNAKELRAAIQTISKHYPAAASQASPKAPEVRPRAPKPPSEVGGRSSATDDAWKGMNFDDFSTRQSRSYAR